MPSEKILTAKQAYVAELKEKIANSVAGVVVDYKGINVADDTKLRKELREAGVEYFVVKNTMLRLAISGTELEGMNVVLDGTTALAIAKEDRIAAARIKDPSLHNWLALALAVRGEGISDFPICNKSFNLSYCGHDL